MTGQPAWPLTSHGPRRTTGYGYDAAGNLIESRTAVAKATQRAGSLADRYEYTGREYYADAYLQHNRARWFDPYTSRWLSEDPIGFAGGDANLYRYAGNSYPNATDPSGMFVPGAAFAGALLGAIGGGALGAASYAVTSWVTGQEMSNAGLWGAVAGGTAGGAVFGALASGDVAGIGTMALIGAAAGGVGGATGAAVSSTVQLSEQRGGLGNLSWSDVGTIGQNALVGGVAGAMGGAIGGAFGGVGGAVAQAYGQAGRAASGAVGQLLFGALGSQLGGGAAGALHGGWQGMADGQGFLAGAAEGWSQGVVAGAVGFATAMGGGGVGRGVGAVVKSRYGGLAGQMSAWAHEAPSFRQGLASGVSKWLRVPVCFAAGTSLLTPGGSKPIERFRVGDLVLARDENDPDAPVEARAVEEVFVRSGFLLHLHVGGQVVRTTSEHPFYVKGEGWVQAALLRPGDLLSSHDGQWVEVEEVYETGEYETVYNLRVADFHTYFVGCDEWGFSVWAHNASYSDWVKANKDAINADRATTGESFNKAASRIWKSLSSVPRPATNQPMGGGGSVLRDGAGATAAEVAASTGGPGGGSRSGQATARKNLAKAIPSGTPFNCWRCGQTTLNLENMHLGHRNTPTSKGGNLDPANIVLEGAACNLSAGNRGGPSPGMDCASRGSCGAPYGRTD